MKSTEFRDELKELKDKIERLDHKIWLILVGMVILAGESAPKIMGTVLAFRESSGSAKSATYTKPIPTYEISPTIEISIMPSVITQEILTPTPTEKPASSEPTPTPGSTPSTPTPSQAIELPVSVPNTGRGGING